MKRFLFNPKVILSRLSQPVCVCVRKEDKTDNEDNSTPESLSGLHSLCAPANDIFYPFT